MDELFPNIVAIYRAIPPDGGADTAVGGAGYSGMTSEPAAGDNEGETLVQSGVAANVQATQQGRKKNSALPSDAVWAPTWVIYVAPGAVAKGIIRDRDVVYDEEGYRYQVGQNYFLGVDLGWKLTCIRLEA